MKQLILILFVLTVSTASDCDVPLVDRQLEFAVLNASQDTLALFVSVGDLEDYPTQLPVEEQDLSLTDPFAPGDARWLAAPTDGPNYFEEAPGGLLRIWVFRTEVIRNVPYDSVRNDTSLFRALTYTEEEFAAVGDTLVIE